MSSELAVEVKGNNPADGTVVNGLPLEILRADYQQSLEPITIEPLSKPVLERVYDPLSDHNGNKATEKPAVRAIEDEFTIAMCLKAESKLDPAPSISSAPVTPPVSEQADTSQIGSKEGEEEDSDDDEGIKGVYWEDMDGRMVELE